MDNEVKFMIGRIYFAIFGLVVLSIGILEILLSLTGRSFEWGIMEMSGEFLLWRGLILFFAGAFYLPSIKNFTDIHQLAKVVMASVMIWIIAGVKIFSMILESIPGEEGWLNTFEGFLESYSAPYIPSLFLLPFSLVVLYYIRLSGEMLRGGRR
ncbi:MAG TPA: hypothetical protein ENI33_08045 [Thermoplasmatales archaeon]|nr:hypothetical protein [Thermoplasmatales archaeon]